MVSGIFRELSVNTFSDATEQAILRFINDKWENLSESQRPWGVWIRRYASVLRDGMDIDISEVPLRAWFMDMKSLREENVWSWQRLVAAHVEMRWHTGSTRLYSPSFGKTYEIGLAAFAPVSDDKAYCEVMWGGLYGSGYHLTLTQGRIIGTLEIWKA